MWNPILEGRIPLPKFGMRIINSSAPVVTGLRARVEWQKFILSFLHKCHKKKLSQIYTLNLLKFHIGIYEKYLNLRFCIHLETKHKQSHLRPGYVQLSINPKKIVIIIFYFATKKKLII